MLRALKKSFSKGGPGSQGDPQQPQQQQQQPHLAAAAAAAETPPAAAAAAPAAAAPVQRHAPPARPHPAAAAQAVAGAAAGAPQGAPPGDGGAAIYKQLEVEAAKKLAQASESTFGEMKIKATKQATKAVNEQSQRVRQGRLMKELKDINRSKLHGDIYTVDLHADNLFEWDVKVHKFDPDSALSRDLKHMELKHGVDNVWLRVSFPSNFPFVPPFVRVLAPLVQGGYVLTGGAICMELLTPQGWSQAYRMESVIMQIIATMARGKARIVASVRKPFSEEEAKKSYDYLVKTHDKHGWNTPPVEDG